MQFRESSGPVQGFAAKLDAYVASAEALQCGSTSMETLQAACCEVLAALQARPP